jgi:hypothetical protein
MQIRRNRLRLNYSIHSFLHTYLFKIVFYTLTLCARDEYINEHERQTSRISFKTEGLVNVICYQTRLHACEWDLGSKISP